MQEYIEEAIGPSQYVDFGTGVLMVCSQFKQLLFTFLLLPFTYRSYSPVSCLFL